MKKIFQCSLAQTRLNQFFTWHINIFVILFSIVALSQALGGALFFALLSYFELQYCFWGEAGGKKLLMYLMVPFPQFQTDVNHKQPMRECVNVDPRQALAWKYFASMSGV